MGPKLRNCCKQEQVGKRVRKMFKRIQVFEDATILAKEARNWKIEGQTRRITRKEHQRLFK